MNLLCPNCQGSLTIADQQAGQSVQCPHCGHAFTAPALAPITPGGAPSHVAAPVASDPLGPAVHVEAPSVPALEEPLRLQPLPSTVNSRSTSTATAGGPRTVVPTAAPPVMPPVPPANGYRRHVVLHANPHVVPWLAPVSLVLTFVVLAFAWIVLPTKTDVYQTGWGTGFGHDSTVLGTFHLIFFLLTLLAAIAVIVIPLLDVRLPHWAGQLWPWRAGLVALLAFLMLLFLMLEVITTFGLEYSMQGLAEEYALRRTGWLWLGVLFSWIAFIGACLEVWLAARKNRPLPRVEISW